MRRLALFFGKRFRRASWPRAGALLIVVGMILAAAGCDRTRPYQAPGAPTAEAPAAAGAQNAVPPTGGTQSPAAAQGPVQTAEGWKFTFVSPGANSVALAGSFNSWSTSADPMQKGEGGVWVIVKPLAPGTYQYKFVVDGTDWKEDPSNPNTADDGYGGKNSVLVVP